MRQQYWSTGQPIVVYVLPSQHQLHQRFSKEVLGIFPYQLDRIWDKLTYSGIGTAPIAVDSVEALFEAVKNTPGAIGYGVNIESGEAVHVIKLQ